MPTPGDTSPGASQERNHTMSDTKKIPDWIIHEGFFPPKVRVLCPDEEHHAVFRGQTAQQKGELQAQSERLTGYEYSKILIRNSFVSWTLVDIDGQPLPQLSEVNRGPSEEDKIWSKLPSLWFERCLAGLMVLEDPTGGDALGGVLEDIERGDSS